MMLTLLLSYHNLLVLLMFSLVFADKQWNDPALQSMILYLRDGELPDNVNLVRRMVTESTVYTMADIM